MSGVVLSGHKAGQTGHKAGQTGLNKALVYEDGYLNWGWWCPDKNCSPDADNLTQQDGFKNRDNARRAAHRHEKEAGH